MQDEEQQDPKRSIYRQELDRLFERQKKFINERI